MAGTPLGALFSTKTASGTGTPSAARPTGTPLALLFAPRASAIGTPSSPSLSHGGSVVQTGGSPSALHALGLTGAGVGLAGSAGALTRLLPPEVLGSLGLLGSGLGLAGTFIGSSPAPIKALGAAGGVASGLASANQLVPGGFLAPGAAEALQGVGGAAGLGLGINAALNAKTDVGKAGGATSALGGALTLASLIPGLQFLLPFGIGAGIAGSGTSLLGTLFGHPGVYAPKRAAAAKTASQDLQGLAGSLAAGRATGDPAKELQALNFLSGDTSSIPGRNPVRSSILMAPEQAQVLGVTGAPTNIGGHNVNVPWTALTPAQFSALLQAIRRGTLTAYAQNPTPGAGNAPLDLKLGEFQTLGSGDVAYLPYSQAVGVANQVATSTLEFLRSVVASLPTPTPTPALAASPAPVGRPAPARAGPVPLSQLFSVGA